MNKRKASILLITCVISTFISSCGKPEINEYPLPFKCNSQEFKKLGDHKATCHERTFVTYAIPEGVEIDMDYCDFFGPQLLAFKDKNSDDLYLYYSNDQQNYFPLCKMEAINE